MHSGQIGFWQTAQLRVTGTRGCLAQNFEAAAGAGGAGADGVSSRAILRRGAATAGSGGMPNSCRMRSLTRSDESRPHRGQTNLTGSSAISGVVSNSYFAPQAHWIFMASGLGIQ